MHLLIREVPPSQRHLFSISEMTALAFLLLAATLFACYRRRYGGGQGDLLYSLIRLMHALRYPQKFLLISLVLLLPTLWLAGQQIAALDAAVRDARLKIVGLDHIIGNSLLARAVAEHRGMTRAHQHDPTLFVRALADKQVEIDALFRANHLLDRSQAPAISVPEYWPQVELLWRRIKQAPDDPRQWRWHTSLIALLLQHNRQVIHESRLDYESDPGLRSRLLLLAEHLPQLLETLGQLRGQGAGLLAAAGRVDPQVRLRIDGLLGRVRSQLLLVGDAHEAIEGESFAGEGEAEEHEPPATDPADRFVERVEPLIALTEQEVLRRPHPLLSARDYFVRMTAVIRAGFDWQQQGLGVLRGRLVDGVEQRVGQQYRIKLFLLVALIAALLFFAAFYRSVMRTIAALDAAVERVRRGDGREHGLEVIECADEMGDMVRAFDAVLGELARVAGQMEAVVRHAAVAIVTIDAEGAIRLFNPAAERIFGYEAKEVVGRNVMMLMPGPLRERHRRALRDRLAGRRRGALIGTSMPVRIEGQRRNGERFPLELSVGAMEIDGAPMFVGMMRDITEEQRLQQQLRHAQRVQSIGTLVGGVAHNFNNMLGGIVGKLYLAKSRMQPDAQVRRYLEEVEEIVAHAAAMIKDLLTYARKDFFREMRDVVLNPLVDAAARTAALGISEDVTLHVACCPEPLTVHGDAGQIQQVVVNLINNARDAVAGCRLREISVDLRRCRPDDAFFARHPELQRGSDYARIEVCDTGCGMDEETRAQIFEPFFTTKEVGAGTGLGLSTAYGTVTNHGGAIEVVSAPGEGSCFRIFLPLLSAAAEEEGEDPPGEVRRAAEGVTLLLVDDDDQVRRALGEVLEELGYRVLTAADGRAALELFHRRREEIACVVSDVVMPEMGGIELLRAIRAAGSTVPVVLLTGYDRGRVELSEEERTGVELLGKPVWIPLFSQRIDQVIHGRKAGGD
ncbi:MAG: PAS domain S-box protein [Zetaproteobacteria bacterium]|nr:MAG: PAS domain S-box protein [Zetaproteobacteria bacterium]